MTTGWQCGDGDQYFTLLRREGVTLVSRVTHRDNRAVYGGWSDGVIG
jgi:ADP-ribosylglycohydrolase